MPQKGRSWALRSSLASAPVAWRPVGLAKEQMLQKNKQRGNAAKKACGGPNCPRSGNVSVYTLLPLV